MLRRGHKLYYRHTIPVDAQGILNRVEVWRSLRTDSLAVAVRRLPSVPAGAGSTLDGAAPCRASKGRASDKGRGRARRGTVRHERSCFQSGVGLAGPALAVPSAPTANSFTGSTPRGADPDHCSSWSTTSSPRRVMVPARPLAT
ncbi:DUF6538 domain-containing protein [Sphingomonas sp. Y38-1Y]|uniref:DUF6538 domain-containing protein n=1 Tax=Sphingomonas sp. Y38-1Y TaxID=3078265 RepID=UPI003964797D